jgi:hypothetical protein
MSVRILVLSMLLVFSGGVRTAAAAVDPDPQTLGERADAQAEQITNAQAFVDEIDRSLALARKGGYGPLKKGSEKTLKADRDVIADLLKGHATASELKPDDRIAVYNAQEEITSILNNKDKNRMVCRKEAPIGTRIQTNICMTVAEREARAAAAKENTGDVQRERCAPGETACGK